MKVGIRGPQTLRGEVIAPRSKAYTHRTLIASLLTPGETTIGRPLRCDDTEKTLLAIRAMGAKALTSRDGIRLHGVGVPSAPTTPIDCGESGATLRFLTAISSTSLNRIALQAKGRLSDRPLLPLIKALKELGASARLEETGSGLQVNIQGPLKGGSATIVGDTSSQFISGLLFAAPLARREVTLAIKGRIESRPYVDMTLEVLRRHGVSVRLDRNEFRIHAPQQYQPASHQVPGDFSSAAFLLAAAGMLGEKIAISDLDGTSSLEPDAIILDLLSQMGAEVEKKAEVIMAGKGQLEGFEFDASDHPDLVPVLEVLACHAKGKSKIRGVRRLRYKESDRLNTVPEELEKMGAKIHLEEDRVLIEGGQELIGNELSSHHDHRVAMACTIASLGARGPSLIEDAGVVSKSYPEFFGDLERLGVKLHVE